MWILLCLFLCRFYLSSLLNWYLYHAKSFENFFVLKKGINDFFWWIGSRYIELYSTDNFFFFFGHPHGIWKFLGWGSNLSHTYGNTRSLTHCAVMGIKSVPQESFKPLQRQWQILNLLCHNWNSIFIFV